MGDETPGALTASVTSSGSQAVMTGVGVSSSLANATVTSGAISNTLSGTATQNNVTSVSLNADGKTVSVARTNETTIPVGSNNSETRAKIWVQ